MTSAAPDNSSRCPSCGAPNGCAIAAGSPAADCWCMTEPRGLPLPKENTSKTASCWCRTCLQKKVPFGSAD